MVLWYNIVLSIILLFLHTQLPSIISANIFPTAMSTLIIRYKIIAITTDNNIVIVKCYVTVTYFTINKQHSLYYLMPISY